MRNLAGETMADVSILDELASAGIEVVEGDKNQGEVPYTLTGQLGDWNFRRAWYYWMVNAPEGKGLPLEVAKALNATHGSEVRVNGMAGGDAPRGDVSSYHVDTQEGLLALAEKIRATEGLSLDDATSAEEIAVLRERLSALYTEWEVEGEYQDGTLKAIKKRVNIDCGTGLTATELTVGLLNEETVAYIAMQFQDNDGRKSIRQYWFDAQGKITSFNYGWLRGPGEPSPRRAISRNLRPEFEEFGEKWPDVLDHLVACVLTLQYPDVK